MGQKPPNALQKRSQEVGLPARCNPFPYTPGRGSLLPVQRLGGTTDATARVHRSTTSEKFLCFHLIIRILRPA